MRKDTVNKKSSAVISLALTASLLLTACGTVKDAAAGNSGSSNSGLSGTISISGSTSVQPLVQDLADIFSEKNPDVTIEVQGGGSSQGIKSAGSGISDIGSSSRDLKAEEKEGITEHVIAYDAIAVVLHPSNRIDGLTSEQLKKIFSGEITNWKDVGGSDQEILVVTREAGSGTRSAFQELLGLEEKTDDGTRSLIRDDALVADGNGSVKANIASKENSIGYISLGFTDETLKKIKVDGIECTTESVKDKSYKISRPFLLLTKGALRPEVKAFLDFILSDEGQELAAASYIPVK